MPPRIAFKAALLASALILTPFAAEAEKAAPLSLGDLAPASPAKVDLKRLPAGQDELTFYGETGARSWRVSLTPAEAARVSAFQLAAERSVVVLPEQSGVTLTVNGQTLATVAPQATEKPKVVTIKIPPGLLVAGENVVRLDVALAHRVDCSLQATYELWARMDPAATGFVGAATSESYRSLKDLASETVGEDGATHVRARLEADASPETVARYARFLGGVARRAGLRRAVVEAAPEPGQGAGFDLLIAADPEQLVADGGARLIGRDGDVLFLRNADTGRLTVALNGADGAGLDAALVALGDRASPTGQGEQNYKFSDLDLFTGPFAGRHYLSTTPIELPGDFFSANYDSVNVWLDAAHVAGLDGDAGIAFRVNGAIASSLPFAGDQAESFSHRLIPLPLAFFRPGHNELTIEGFVGAPSDAQCDIGAGARAERLRIEPSSEIRLPRMVRLAETPRIASAVQAAREADHGLDVYIPGADAASIGLALTTLADLDLVDAAKPPRVHFRAPANGDRPGLFVSLADAAPANLALTSLRKDDAAPAQNPAYAAPGFLPEAFRQRLDRLAGQLRAAPAAGLRLPDKYLAVAAVAPQAQGAVTGALRPPQFIDSPAQWLAVLASDPLAETEGAAHFAANGGFTRLTGQTFAYDVTSGATSSVEPDKLAYVMPRRLDPLDVRPILGGLFAENMTLTLAAFALLIGVLGVSTHALVRRIGASDQ